MTEKKMEGIEVAPKGIAGWVSLHRPNKYNKYDVKCRFNANDPAVKRWLKTLDRYYEQAEQEAKKEKVRKGGHPPYTEELDENDDPTGFVVVKFSKSASGETSDGRHYSTKPPKIVDASGKTRVTQPVYAGSELVIAYRPKTWNSKGLGFGVSLKPIAAQVIKLVSSGEVDTEALFEEEEGFDATQESGGDEFDEGTNESSEEEKEENEEDFDG